MKPFFKVAFVVAAVLAANGCGESDTSSTSSEPTSTTPSTETGSGESGTSQAITDPPQRDEPGASAPLMDLADATVPCAGESMTNSFDYADGKPGAATIEEAVDSWTFEGSAPYLRAELVSFVDTESGRAALVDGDGNLRILLTVRENENGWLVESSQRCLDP